MEKSLATRQTEQLQNDEAKIELLISLPLSLYKSLRCHLLSNLTRDVRSFSLDANSSRPGFAATR